MGRLNLLFMGSAVLLLAGCQQKERTPIARCIYDQPAFAECSLGAAGDPEQFATFKRHPFFNLLWENISREEGEVWATKILTGYPRIMEKLEQIKESDQIGSPRVYPYEGMGELSPSTLRFAALSGELQERCGAMAGMRVVQIGAGYGGLCRVLHAVGGFESYTLVDLPEQLALARMYLETFGVDRVRYLTPEELPSDARYDLVISDMGFSEFNRSFQELFFDRILAHSRSGFLLGHVFPKHYGVVALNFDEVMARFEKNGHFSIWEMQEPTMDRENYFIFWKREEISRK